MLTLIKFSQTLEFNQVISNYIELYYICIFVFSHLDISWCSLIHFDIFQYNFNANLTRSYNSYFLTVPEQLFFKLLSKIMFSYCKDCRPETKKSSIFFKLFFIF